MTGFLLGLATCLTCLASYLGYRFGRLWARKASFQRQVIALTAGLLAMVIAMSFVGMAMSLSLSQQSTPLEVAFMALAVTACFGGAVKIGSVRKCRYCKKVKQCYCY